MDGTGGGPKGKGGCPNDGRKGKGGGKGGQSGRNWEVDLEQDNLSAEQKVKFMGSESLDRQSHGEEASASLSHSASMPSPPIRPLSMSNLKKAKTESFLERPKSLMFSELVEVREISPCPSSPGSPSSPLAMAPVMGFPVDDDCLHWLQQLDQDTIDTLSVDSPTSEEVARFAVDAALEKPVLGSQAGGTLVSMDSASHSAAHDTEAALVVDRPVAKVLELARSTLEVAVHNELASQAKGGCRRATPVSSVLIYSAQEPEAAQEANAPGLAEVPQQPAERPRERPEKQVEPPVAPADESPKPAQPKQPVGPSGQDKERKSMEVPTPSQATVHQPTVGNCSNAVPTVERIDACRKAKVIVAGTVVQEELVTEAALRTELASQTESKHDGGMMPVPVGAASYSAAHKAESVLLVNRSGAEVFEEAVQSELETRPGAATPVSSVLIYSAQEPEAAQEANAPGLAEVPQQPAERPRERPEKQVEPPVAPADESPKPAQPKQPVGPSGQDKERKSVEVPTPSQATVHQPTVGNCSNAVPTVERIDARRKAKVIVAGTVVQEELVTEAALRTELASQTESKHDGGMMPVPVGAASYSAAHKAESVLLVNRSGAEVFEEAVQSELETRPGAATPAETRCDGRAPELVKSAVEEASVGGDSHSAADEALLANRSVQEVFSAEHWPAPEHLELQPKQPMPKQPRSERLTPKRPVTAGQPVAPKQQLREEAPVRPEQPVEPVTPGGTAPSQASIDPEQQVVEPSSAVACRDAVSVVASAGDAPEELPPSACTSSPKLDCTQEALADSSKKAHIFPAPQVEAIPVTGEVSTIRDHTATPTTKDDAFDESRAVQLHDHAVKVAEVSSKSRSSASSFGGKEFEIKTSKANLRANQDRVPAGHVSAELMEELGQIVNRPRFSILKKAKTEGDLETRPKLCLRFSAEVDIREVPLLSPASSPSSPVNSKQFQAVSPNSKSPGSHASDTLTLPLSRTMARETRRGSRGCELPPSSPVAATRSEAEPCVGPFTVEKRSQGFKQEVESQNAVRFEEGSASNAAGFLVWKELDSCAFEPQVQQSSCAAAEHKEPVSPAREQGNQNSIATFARYLYQIARPNHESASGKVETVQHPADKADNHQNQPIDLPVQHVQQLQTTLNCPEELVRYHRHHKHGKHHKHHSSRPHDSHRSSHSRRRSWKVEGEATAIPAPGSGAMPKKGGSWENLPSSNEKHGYHYYGTCEVTDEMVITAQRGGLTPDLENRVLERAYFLFINGVSDDQCSNYFEALRVELGLMMSSNQMV